jgi:hypothetical protein
MKKAVYEIYKSKYYGLNLETGKVHEESGQDYSIEEFKKMLTEANEHGNGLNVTLMLQRFINYNYDIERLKEFYKNN